jgi:metallo-beta-lactamase class B
MKRRILAMILLALGSQSAAWAQAPKPFNEPPPPQSEEIQRHVDAAARIAGPQFAYIARYMCQPRNERVAMIRVTDKSPMVPTKIFDQLYYFGTSTNNVWALQTTAGIILIDALDNRTLAQANIIDKMPLVGLDPTQIKYVVVTHGHTDHYGGTSLFKEKYKATILMGKEDWDMLDAQRAKAASSDAPIIERDQDVVDGKSLTLGDTTMRFYSVPGHTPGSIALVFPVTAKGQQHVATLYGGTGPPTGLPRESATYVASLQHFRPILEKSHADVLLANHPMYDLAVDNTALMRTGGANRFIVGHEALLKYNSFQEECGKVAQLQGSQTTSH